MRAINIFFTKLNATPDVRVSVRRVIITIPIPKTSIVVVIPIPTDIQDTGIAHTTHIEYFFVHYIKGEVSPLTIPLLKRFVAKATPEARVSVRRDTTTTPKPKTSIVAAIPIPTDTQDSTTISISIITIISII